MNGESSKLFEKLKVYKNYSNDSIFFKYIFNESDIPDEDSKRPLADQDENVFKPEYTHQIFGDEEVIFGYKNLRINYYLTPGLLDAYIGLSYKEKVSPQRFEGIEPDDVFASFVEFGCSPGFTRNLNVFRTEKLAQDFEFRPYGTKICQYSRELIQNETSNYEIYRVDSKDPEYTNEKFIDYILRVQTMLVFYIETSSFVDTDDSNWTYYLLYQKIKHQSSVSTTSNTEYRYATIGYVSVYNYYGYPDKTRSRISQIMIFPQYEKQGHGAEIVEAVYRDAIQNPGIIDVTAESPTPEFIRLRDFVTTKMCLGLSSFKDRNFLKNGYSNEMMLEALKKLKIPKLQSRRCYEILRLSVTNQNKADEWTSYRLDLKKRFYLPFIRKSKYAKKCNTYGSGGSDETHKTSLESVPVQAKPKGFESRFGGNGAANRLIGIGEEEGTTIGFGANAKPVGASTFFINTGQKSSVSFNGNGKSSMKGVSFSSTNGNGAKLTSLNTSNSTTDSSEADVNDENNGLAQADFVSEKERKKHLEEQFQESVTDYSKVIKRLELANIIN